MSLVLGIDPGATTGWCLYDSAARRVVACGSFPGHDVHGVLPADAQGAVCVIERVLPHGGSFPDVVHAAYTAGRLVEIMRGHGGIAPVEIPRHDVRGALQEGTHGAIRVKDDKTVWAALVLLHGDGSDAKPTKKNGMQGGPLGLVTGHARAALAVAVAFVLRRGVQ